MIPQQVLVGSVSMALCILLVTKERWFLETTSNGQRLVRALGPNLALWVLRGLAAGGTIFGGLLAAGIIRPVKW